MSTLNFEPFARIEELENRIDELEQAKQDATEAMEIYVERIEQLEAALRKIAELEYLTDEAMQKIAEDALDHEDSTKREENSDVGPGFRGNNDHA
jgi:DNA-binding ferritin-like protein